MPAEKSELILKENGRKSKSTIGFNWLQNFQEKYFLQKNNFA